TPAGMPSSRAMMAAWQVRPPRLVTMAAARFMTGSQSGSVMSATKTSPARTRDISFASLMIRASRADTLSDAATAGEHLGTCFQGIAQYRAPGAALHRFRAGL